MPALAYHCGRPVPNSPARALSSLETAAKTTKHGFLLSFVRVRGDPRQSCQYVSSWANSRKLKPEAAHRCDQILVCKRILELELGAEFQLLIAAVIEILRHFKIDIGRDDHSCVGQGLPQ